ncbi:MAG TPA: HD domain-containing phosphohydrolase, partial [Solirubrobacteraceae bacterium]|nr:HD domain-containing phosphohydrolase [Solirubrobacteraceae bacterium]
GRRLGMDEDGLRDLALAAVLVRTDLVDEPPGAGRTAFDRAHALLRHAGERWDGTGAPDGLARDAIPLGARVLAACADGVTSADLRAGAGTRFDPAVVDAVCADDGTAGG